MKLYTNDPDVPYTTTKILPLRTKADIDGILARWGITKVAWEFNPDCNKIVLHFQFNEKFKDKVFEPVVVLEPPRIWNKKTRRKEESINWAVSMRVLFWYIKNTLAMAYAMQSERTVAFLPHIETPGGQTVKELIIPRIGDIDKFRALEDKTQ